MLDLLIVNGTVIDGTGGERKASDIGIKDGRIHVMGDLAAHPAIQRIDANGLYIAPGFIDLHSHSDFSLLLDGRGESFVRQGVTTEVIGNCGLSCAPLGNPSDLKRNVFCHMGPYTARWSDMEGYLSELETAGLGINVAPLAGHAALRSFVMGYERRHASGSEISKMAGLLEQCLDSGAWGFSTGLEYFPGIDAATEEIHGLCRITAKYGGLYTTHVKNRDEQYRMGFSEAFGAAAETGVKLQISHTVPKYGAPDDAADWLLRQLERYGKERDIACDVIPYEWGPTTMTAILPADLLKEDIPTIVSRLGRRATRDQIKSQKQPFWLLLRDRCWERIVLYQSEKFRDLIGKSALELAAVFQTSPYDALLDILMEEGENMFSVLMMGEIKRATDLTNILPYRLTGVISDGLSLSTQGPLNRLIWSPGCFGWVGRYFDRFVGEGKLLTLEEGVAKITGFAAKRLGLTDRGLLKPGNWADLVVFDVHKLKDKASFIDPKVYPEGIQYVLINGRMVVENGKYIGLKNGTLLRKGAFRR